MNCETFDDIEFPSTWRLCAIDEVYRFTKKPRTLTANPSIPFFPMAALPLGRMFLDSRGAKRVESVGSATYVENGDLLLAKITPSFENGKQVILKMDEDYGFATTEVFALKPVEGVSSIEYLFHVLKHPQLRSSMAAGMQGSTGRQRLSKPVLREQLIPLPPLDEQRKIAEMLSTVQKAIEEQGRLIDLTTELKKTLMHKLFTEGTRGEPQKDTEVGPVPESWEIVRLDTTGDVIYGIQAAVATNLEPIGLPIITNKNITLDGLLDFTKLNYFELRTKRHKATVLQMGDLLFNWRSGSKEHVGKTAFFDLEGQYTHSSFILRIRPKKHVNGRYLYYFLQWLRRSGYFVKLQTYAVNAKFNKTAVNALPTALPQRDEQDRIADMLESIAAKERAHREKQRCCVDLFRTLLHELMTGVTRVDKIDLDKALAPRLEQAGLPLAGGTLDLDEIETQTMGENRKP